jgi:hypothetical protein
VEREDQAGAYSFLGDVAHIHARRDGGPRADVALSERDRDHSDNLFLLCLDHHTIVDDHPEIYTAAKLLTVRDAHHAWVKAQLSSGSPWKSDLYNFFYINLPRILMLAEVMGVQASDAGVYYVNDISALEGNYIPFMRALQPVIEKIHPNVIPLDKLSYSDGDVGLIARFDQRFRTKNLGKALTRGFSGFTGDLAIDPHIYTECNGYKVIMPIDPRWLTTTTAGVHLSSGQGVFAGLCIVNSVDPKHKVLMCSLLILGQTKKW